MRRAETERGIVHDGQSPKDPLTTLAAQAIRGEPGALRGLLSGVAPDVSRVVAKIVHGADHDDVVQESLIALVAALPNFRGDGAVRHFARRIAVRVALRDRKRRRRHESGALPVEHEHLASDGLAPDERARSFARRSLLMALLDELPRNQAETLALRVVLGMSLAETAEATGVPANTVRSRLRLARAALKKRIEADPQLAELLEVAP